MSTIKNNTTELYNILNAINNLPEAEEGVTLPELTNEGTASDLMASKELIDGEGNKITGTFTIDNELSTQDNLISQIQTALNGKATAAPKLQEKTATPTTSTQTITPDSSYDGLSKVTVGAIPSTYVKPTTTKTATTYTPTTSNQTIAAGTYCSGAQTIKGDANLKAENIAEGVSIFGVTGTHSGGSGGGGGFETISGRIMYDGLPVPGGATGQIFYIDGSSNYQSSTWSSDFSTQITVLKNSIVVVTGWSSMSIVSGGVLVYYGMQTGVYFVTDDGFILNNQG